MIRDVLDLEETTVRAVMVPRVDMVSVPLSTPLEAVVDVCSRAHLNRLPVYGENRDDVRGIADLRDALRGLESDADLADALQEPGFVPASKPVDQLLAEVQTDGRQMVVVVDEFGAVVGIATLEDVVEEATARSSTAGRPTPPGWSTRPPRWRAAGRPSPTSTR